jgi:hypothetical protein
MAWQDYPFGTGPLGFDPVIVTDARPFARAPSAQEFDLATKDFPLDSAGNFRALHPVDQGVALSFVRRGSIKSAPLVGNTLHLITDMSPARLEQQVQTRVDDAFPLRVLVKDGSVTTLRIEHDISVHGRLGVAYYFRNNITGRTAPAVRVSYG